MNARFFCGLAALIIGLLLGARGIELLLSPIKYKATAIIKLEPDWPDVPISDSSDVPYDPYFIETELEAIKSESVLSNVVVALNLDEEWGKHYNHGTLDMNEAVQLLRWRMEIKVPRNTRLVQIGVWDEDPAQAAQMANGIARAYSNYRIERHRQMMAGGIEVLKTQYQLEAVEVTNMESQLEQLGRQLKVTNPEPSGDVLKAYFQAKKQLQDRESLHTLLGEKIIQDENDTSIPHQVMVTMIDPADAANVVRSQHRQLGAAFLIGGLGLAGYGFYLMRPARRAAGTPV